MELSRDPPPNANEKVFVIKGTPYQIHHVQHIIRIKVGDIAPGTPVPPFPGGISTQLSTTGGIGANPYGPASHQFGAPEQFSANPTAQWQPNGRGNYFILYLHYLRTQKLKTYLFLSVILVLK